VDYAVADAPPKERNKIGSVGVDPLLPWNPIAPNSREQTSPEV